VLLTCKLAIARVVTGAQFQAISALLLARLLRATNGVGVALFFQILGRRWIKWGLLLLFSALAAGAVVGHLVYAPLAAQYYVPALSAALSIGTSGIAAFIFYYVVSERLENRRHNLVRQGAFRTYKPAKQNIDMAIIHACQKGGRTDLTANCETVERIMTDLGLKDLFAFVSKADESFTIPRIKLANTIQNLTILCST
jgi:hypothetical protein